MGKIPGSAPPKTRGSIAIPASKSHTIRALLTAAFARGESRLIRPLVSRDAMSCRRAVEILGARVREEGPDWIVSGFGSIPPGPESTGTAEIDTGNSGTTLYLTSALAALGAGPVRFTGDEQIRRRTAAPLLEALRQLGVQVEDSGNGCAPFTVTGPLRGGSTELDCPVSQYLSALLLAAPLVRPTREAPRPLTRIKILRLNEAPYVEMTLDWLKRQNIRYEQEGWKEFRIPGNQQYTPFSRSVPADWSSAAFFMAAAAITGGTLVLEGLDTRDSQGDKAVAGMLEKMGCRIREIPDNHSPAAAEAVEITGGPLKGAAHDLNATPDALPAMAVVSAFAEGESRLFNVPQARMKETDRIAVMCAELQKLGVETEELPDGIIIRGQGPEGRLQAREVDGHGDHRVVMALAAAALGCEGTMNIKGAEAADITFPGFFELLEQSVGRKA